jgi:HNH endonuclease
MLSFFSFNHCVLGIQIDTESGCWEWQGKINDRGYGVIRIAGKDHRAHRVMWEMHYGSITPGYELHHKCENRRCCNPDHLVMLTHKEHLALHPDNPFNLGNGGRGLGVLRERCRRGHLLTPENTWIRASGVRVCKECSNQRIRDWRAKKNRPPGRGERQMEPGRKGGHGQEVEVPFEG